MKVQETAVQTDRVLTVPNLLTMLRLVAVPGFLWLLLGPHADGAAAWVLVGSGFTDWLDGYVARATGSISRIGQLLDPLADRLFILGALGGLLLRGLVPWWWPVLLVARDLGLAVLMAALKRRGVVGLPVHFPGKAATFSLLLSFPLLVVATGSPLARILGVSLAVWGTGLYLYAGWLYWQQGRPILSRPRAGSAPV